MIPIAVMLSILREVTFIPVRPDHIARGIYRSSNLLCTTSFTYVVSLPYYKVRLFIIEKVIEHVSTGRTTL